MQYCIILKSLNIEDKEEIRQKMLSAMQINIKSTTSIVNSTSDKRKNTKYSDEV